MMTLVTAFFNAIAAVPSVVSALEKLVAFVSEQLRLAKVRQSEKEMAKATEVAKEKKDTSQMDQMFDPRKKK